MHEPRDDPNRLLDIFPPGFDTGSSFSPKRSHYNFSPEQLYGKLTRSYSLDNHIEWMQVNTIWYGKQTKKARHEFILIEVEDTMALLKNFIVLDRNHSSDPPVKKNRDGNRSPGTIGCSSSACQYAASDAFRVAYDGREKRLLEECQLWPRRYLEKLDFNQGAPLFLYELVTLVNHVSDTSLNYALVGENCYWFAGVIWQCIRALRPDAHYTDSRSQERGKLAILRCTPCEAEVEEIRNAFEQEVRVVERRLERLRNESLGRSSAGAEASNDRSQLLVATSSSNGSTAPVHRLRMDLSVNHPTETAATQEEGGVGGTGGV